MASAVMIIEELFGSRIAKREPLFILEQYAEVREFVRRYDRIQVDDTERETLGCQLRADRVIREEYGLPIPEDQPLLEQGYYRFKGAQTMSELENKVKGGGKGKAAKAAPAKAAAPAPKGKAAPDEPKKKGAPKKTDGVIATIETMMRRPKGASVSEMMEALKAKFPERGDKMLSTVRIQVNRLPKKLGVEATKKTDEKRGGTVYSLPAAA